MQNDSKIADYKSLIEQVLIDVDYQGDTEKQAEELTNTLQEKIGLAIFVSVKEFFEDYLKAIMPTLNEDQKNRLSAHLTELQNSNV